MNKQMTYWKANKQTTAALREMDQKLVDFLKPYKAFARKHGMSSSRVVTSYNIMGDEVVAGFLVKRGHDDPDSKLWKKHKHTWRGKTVWVPRAVKQMQWWRDHMYDCFFTASEIDDVLGIKCNPPGGLGYCLPGMKYIDDHAYIQIQKWQGEPNGCRRITDVTYERICKGA